MATILLDTSGGKMATKTTGEAAKGYRVVGTRPIRHDGADKVSGKALYGADVQLPGMLYGKVLRSPHAHARIRSIDTRKAEARTGVKAVATHSDLTAASDHIKETGEEAVLSRKYLIDSILAADKVLFKGHPVAAVAAASPHEAEEAVALIDVDYEILPAVINAEDAMKPSAPILHEHITTPGSFDDASRIRTNVSEHVQHQLGDVGAGFGKADLMIEREFRTKTVHQGYIEPQNGVARWSEDGRITIWCSSQGHFSIRDHASSVLGVPISQITVIPMEVGGGFGGKLRAYLEPVAALLSKKSGRAVKMTMTRVEVLEATGPTSGAYVRVKIGVTDEGKFTAAEAFLAFEAGAYPGTPIPGAAAAIFAPYNIENVLIDAYEVLDNKPSTTAYRAPGAPIVAFAVETMVDEICERLGIDRMDFRLLNAAREGTRRADGVMNGHIGATEIMDAVKAHPHYTAPLKNERASRGVEKARGRGVGMGFCRNSTAPASLIASVNTDGSVSVVEGSVDIGGTRTSVAQQLAEVLGIPVEDINPQVGDTDSIGYTSNTSGSSVTFKLGWAAYEAAHDIIQQLVERAAMIWETAPGQVEYTAGGVRHMINPELQMTFKELAALLLDTGGPIVGKANSNRVGSSGSYSAGIADIEVDPETGKVDILRYTAFQDSGTSVHPSYVEGQVQGGTAQGIGWALNEEYVMSEHGELLNSSFLDYRMPTSLDVPMIEAVVVEVPNPGHPFGVRGVGEANIVPPLAVLANSVYDAIGVRMMELPMSPGAIVKALDDHNCQSDGHGHHRGSQ